MSTPERARPPAIAPAIAPSEDVASLCARYVASVRAFTLDEPGADEPLMQAVELHVPITAERRGEFRREIMNFVGALKAAGQPFKHDTNARIHAALVKVLEDARA